MQQRYELKQREKEQKVDKKTVKDIDGKMER